MVTAGLFYLEYQNERPASTPSFFASIIKSLINPGTINNEILAKTSLKDLSVNSESRSEKFFDPYLNLPKNFTASVSTIESTNIKIYEVQSQNPFKIINQLTDQKSQDYQLNQINQSTFYLNQTPSQSKTHNFLAIIINNVLYGFQYKPAEHKKVLEIIDALTKTE